jgi:hypothetical protein
MCSTVFADHVRAAPTAVNLKSCALTGTLKPAMKACAFEVGLSNEVTGFKPLSDEDISWGAATCRGVIG